MRIGILLFLISQFFVIATTVQAADICSDLFSGGPDKTLEEYRAAWEIIKKHLGELSPGEKISEGVMRIEAETLAKKNILMEKIKDLANAILDEAFPRGSSFDPANFSKEQMDRLNLIAQLGIHSQINPISGMPSKYPVPIMNTEHFTPILTEIIQVRADRLSPAVKGFHNATARKRNKKASQDVTIGFLPEPKDSQITSTYVPVWNFNGGQVDIAKIPNLGKDEKSIGFTNP